MASVAKDPNGRKRILFTGVDGVRKCIRIGKTTVKKAEGFAVRIEDLVAARMQGIAIDRETAQWVRDLPDAMHAKLIHCGLVDPRIEQQAAAALSVDDLFNQYILDRDDVGPTTTTIYNLTRRNLVDFFGAGKAITGISRYDAEQWQRKLAKTLSKATVRKRTQTAKQVFNAAIKRRALEENPFSGLKSGAIANKEREYFVSREETQKALDACPDLQWRLIIALGRYGGLRCPSEILAVKWGDIDWARSRILIHASKTKGHEGKGERWVPIFPELRPLLEQAFSEVEPGIEYVVTRYRLTSCNLRTQFMRIIRRAGLTPWPRIFQNLRSTRETELAETWPLHVVTAWIGNSGRVAQKHYLQVTDSHFERATQTAQNAAQSPAISGGKPEQTTRAGSDSPLALPPLARNCGGLPGTQVRPAGLEPATSGLGNRCSIH
jgi:integrase